MYNYLRTNKQPFLMYRGSVYWTRSSRSILNNYKRTPPNIQNGSLLLKSQKSFNSTSSGSGGSGFYLGASVATIGALVGGSTAYAGYDTGFRKSVEDAIPMSGQLFKLVHGEIEERKTPKPPIVKDLSIPFELEETPKEVAGKDATEAQQQQKQKPEKIVSVNTLDTPAVSMIDLDISSIKAKETTTNDQEVLTRSDDEKSHNDQSQEPTNMKVSDMDEDIIIVDAIETIQPTGANEQSGKTEITVPNPDTSVANLEMNVIPPTEVGKDNTLQSDDEGPLTAEEIETLSTLVDAQAMEILVNTSTSNILLLVEQAKSLQKQAADALREYMSIFASALNAPQNRHDDSFKAVSSKEVEAQEKIDAAKKSEISLMAEMESLRNLLASVRQSGDSKIADSAESALNTCSNDFDRAVSQIDVAQKDFDFLLDYQTFITHAPECLRGDLKSFASDLVKLLEENKVDISDLSSEQAILALALNRTKLLEKVLEANPDSKYIEEILEKQQDELKKISEENLQCELKQMETRIETEYQEQIKTLEESYEKEILSQLKRQASAHNGHLADELANQATLMQSKHQTELDSKLLELQEKYKSELEKNVAYINGLNSKIDDVVDIERRQKRAQEIWIATQALHATMSLADVNGRTRTLMPEMIAVLQLGERNETLTEMVNSIPEQAALFGVITEKDLMNRFKRVKHECKKVAMVGEGDSIGMYLLSYVKSLFVISTWYLKDARCAIDPKELTNYEILAKAEYFIQEGDLETAAKLMSQLEGVPRKLSSDWLNEVRLFLETKQTALLLQAYAASLTVGFE